MMKQKIGIVDDHEFFRKGLRLTLQENDKVKLIFEAQNGQEFLNEMKKNPADIVLLDIKMPVMDGYTASLKAKELYPDLKIIVLSMFDNDEYIQKMVEAGVDGFILKNISSTELETALTLVIEGHQYYSNELMDFFIRQVRSRSDIKPKRGKLTAREIEILQLVYEGYTNKEIANMLFVSIRTITNHRTNINAKTGARNTASLITYALKHNLIK